MQANTERDQLVLDHYHRIPKFAKYVKRRCRFLDYDDLIGVGQIALMTAAKNYRGDTALREVNGTFPYYLRRCVVGAMFKLVYRDPYQDIKRTKMFSIDSLTNLPPMQESNSVNPEIQRLSNILLKKTTYAATQLDKLLFDEQSAKLEKCIQSLHPKHEEVLKLKFCQELSNIEIGKIMNISDNVVCKTAKSALKALNNLFAGNSAYEKRPRTLGIYSSKDEQINCACGCGHTMNKMGSDGHPRKYIKGHNWKHAKQNNP